MKKKKLAQGQGQGICPNCGNIVLDYDETEWADESVGYHFICKCRFSGIEWYNLVYDETVAN